MNTKIRFFRKPVTTISWIAVLTAMALLLGIGANMLHSAQSLPDILDRHHTTIAVQGGEELSWLEPADIEKLSQLEMVEKIDLRTLTGAYIPELNAQIGLNDWGTICKQDPDHANHTTNESYNEVVLIGTIEESWMWDEQEQYRQYFDMSDLGHSSRALRRYTVASMRVEEVVSAHGDYLFFENEDYSGYCGMVYLEANVMDEGQEDYFQVGERYIVTGQYDPGCHGRGYATFSTPTGQFYPWLQMSTRYLTWMGAVREGDALIQYITDDGVEQAYPSDYEFIVDADKLGAYVPVAQKIQGSLEDFLAENPIWAEHLDLCEKVQHSFPVMGTEALETMYCFMTNAASMVSGRMFTQEEYDNGSKVCVINEQAALKAGIQVGDTITLSQYLVATDISANRSIPYVTDDPLNNPAVGKVPFPDGFPEEEETFTVVGIYRLERSWDDSSFSITPNTVFIPQKAQIEGGFGGTSYIEELPVFSYVEDLVTGEWYKVDDVWEEYQWNGVRGVYFSIKLKNGTMEDFHTALAEAGMTDYYSTLDQGYEAAKESIAAVAVQAEKLMLIALAGWLLLLCLYILLYQGRERENLGVMRSVGARPAIGRRYLFGSGMALAALGVVLGALLSGWVTALAEDQLSVFLLAEDTMLNISGGQELTGDAVSQILNLGSLPVTELLLLAAAQLAVIAVVLWLHAALISRKTPRKLMGV